MTAGGERAMSRRRTLRRAVRRLDRAVVAVLMRAAVAVTDRRLRRHPSRR